MEAAVPVLIAMKPQPRLEIHEQRLNSNNLYNRRNIRFKKFKICPVRSCTNIRASTSIFQTHPRNTPIRGRLSGVLGHEKSDDEFQTKWNPNMTKGPLISRKKKFKNNSTVYPPSQSYNM